MAFARYSKMDDIAQLHGQPEINEKSQTVANDYDSLQDRKTNDDANVFVTVANRRADSAESKEDATQKVNIPYWIYEHPRRIIALVVVGILLFTTLSCVITGAIIHRMILASLDTRLVAMDRNFNSEHIKGTDSISYSHSDAVGQLDMNRRLENIETSLLNLQDNHTSHIITAINSRLDEMQERQKTTTEGLHKLQENHSYAIHRITGLIDGLHMMQENHSDAIDHLTEVSRQLSNTMNGLHVMQENHSDAIDHLTEVSRQLNNTMNGLHVMQENHSDAIDHLTEVSRQLNNTVVGLHKVQENRSDAIDQLTDGNRQLSTTMDGLHKMQENHSDAIDHLSDLNRRLDKTVQHLNNMLGNRSDSETLDHITDINRRLVNTAEAMYRVLEQMKALVSVSDPCKTCPDGWMQFGDTCYQLSDGNIDFTNIALRTCPDGWRTCNDSCYKKGPSSLTFNSAVEYCKRYNASVAEINTQPENDFMEDFLARSDTCWIGLTDVASENVWRWHSSGTITGFLNWNTGEPNNAGRAGEDCTTIVGGNNCKWNDLHCNRKSTALCEIWSAN